VVAVVGAIAAGMASDELANRATLRAIRLRNRAQGVGKSGESR
jgi:hypothetical protein